MGILNENNTILLIIDIQEKLLNSVYNKEQLEKNALIMTKAASILNIPIIITEQYPKGLGSTITQIKNISSDNTKIFEKVSFSALENGELKNYIKTLNRNQIVILGIETHICVNQTAEALISENYEVNVIENACGSRTTENHIAGLSRMKENGAHIITTEICIFEWLRTSKHPQFKEIQMLIK